MGLNNFAVFIACKKGILKQAMLLFIMLVYRIGKGNDFLSILFSYL